MNSTKHDDEQRWKSLEQTENRDKGDVRINKFMKVRRREMINPEAFMRQQQRQVQQGVQPRRAWSPQRRQRAQREQQVSRRRPQRPVPL